MTKSKLPEGISEKDLENLINNPGTVVSNRSGSAAEVIQAKTHVDITTRQDKGIIPQLGGYKAGDEKITVSKNLAIKLAEGDARIREENARRQAEEQERLTSIELTEPEKVLQRLGYLERTVKAQAKQIKELQG